MSPGNLWIGNLNGEVTDETLATAFSPFGELLSVKVMLDVHTGKTRGFGFVMFKDARDAATAMKQLHGAHLKGSKICITVANNNGDKALLKSNKMCVRNVPKHLSNETVIAHIQQFGKIVNFQFREDDLVPEDASKIYLTNLVKVLVVWFNSSDEVDNAVRQLHNSRPWTDMSVPLLAKAVKNMAKEPPAEARLPTPQIAVLPEGARTLPIFLTPLYQSVMPQCFIVAAPTGSHMMTSWPFKS